MSFLLWASRYMARNQVRSGSLEAWKRVPARTEVWRWQAEHWNNRRGAQKLCSRPPQRGQLQ